MTSESVEIVVVPPVEFEKPHTPAERRERNRREMTEAILSAARVIMQRDGVAALNLHEIARMVGVKTPALYKYFPSKAALYDELFRRGMHQVYELYEALYQEHPPGWERLRAWAEARLAFAHENPDLDHLLFGRDVPGFTPSEASMAIARKRYASAVRAMKEVIDAGTIDPGVPVERALDLFLVVTSGLASQHMANEPQLPVGQGRFGSLIPDAMRLFGAAWTPPAVHSTSSPHEDADDHLINHSVGGTMVQVDQKARSIATDNAVDAVAISPVSPEEAAMLASNELERLHSLLSTFTPEDWEKPTYCTLWNVRQVVSHIAGALSAYADWETLLQRSRPWSEGKAEQPGVTMPIFLADLAGIPPRQWDAYRERFIPLDALNQFEVDQRADLTPAELIAELESVGPAAIANRLRLPDEVRSVLLPVVGARVPVSYLLDVIYPRDIWMHRIELALSTGGDVVRTTEHDGRLTALVMRDLARRLTPVLDNRSVVYVLNGADGGAYRFGPDTSPAAVLTLDAIDFHLLASGRMTASDALALTHVTGDAALTQHVLEETTVVY